MASVFRTPDQVNQNMIDSTQMGTMDIGSPMESASTGAAAGTSPWAYVGAMMLGSFLKNQLIDKPQRKQQWEMRAAETKASPWLGQGSTPAPVDNSGNEMLSAGVSGYMMGQNQQKYENDKEMNNKLNAMLASRLTGK